MPTQVGRASTTFLGARGEVVDGGPSPAMTKVSQSFDGLVLRAVIDDRDADCCETASHVLRNPCTSTLS
jgi:hypothetical protein